MLCMLTEAKLSTSVVNCYDFLALAQLRCEAQGDNGDKLNFWKSKTGKDRRVLQADEPQNRGLAPWTILVPWPQSPA